jgi:Uma2 family endonuclease
MTTSELLTAEEFVSTRDELPDGGRWTELVAGKLVTLSPPTIEHGTAVLNLSKALADYSHKEQGGYACFELGLMTARHPDTVRVPAICFFTDGPIFAEADKVVTEARPTLVVDVASTNDRRRGMEQRVTSWLEWGVRAVWVLDPQAKHVHAVEKGRAGQRFADHQSLSGGSVLSGFEINVGELFKEPGWAR